jgi:hypothetical protein
MEPKTFQIPVFFTVPAESREAAWDKVQEQMSMYTPMPPDWEFEVKWTGSNNVWVISSESRD